MLFSFFISPTFATEINNPATCDSGTLSTDTGPTNLRANYESNQLNLKWYDDTTQLDVTSTNSNTCTYGSAINLPTPPTKRGYTFKGWKVIPQYDFSTLPTNITGTEAYSKGVSGTTSFCCYYDNTDNWYSGRNLCNTNNSFKDLNQHEWKVVFNWGVLYGMGLCSSSSGTYTQGLANPETDNGQYCWCKAAWYMPSDSTTKYLPLNSFIWTFALNRDTAQDCGLYCPNTCARYVERDTYNFLRLMLTRTN